MFMLRNLKVKFKINARINLYKTSNKLTTNNSKKSKGVVPT